MGAPVSHQSQHHQPPEAKEETLEIPRNKDPPLLEGAVAARNITATVTELSEGSGLCLIGSFFKTVLGISKEWVVSVGASQDAVRRHE